MKLRVGTGVRTFAAVVDLADARDGRRVRELHLRLRASLERNRRAIARLFQNGLVYTRAGSRLGRELLLAHQHLLRVTDLLARIGDVPEPQIEASALFQEAHALLSRTAELTARCNVVLAREP